MQTATAVPARDPLLPEPWYRVGVMWLFVGGLGAVVIGSFMLLATAIEHADVELHAIPMKPASYYKAVAAPAAPAAPASPAPSAAEPARPTP